MSSSVRVLLMRPPQQFYFGVWPRGPRLSIPTGLLAIGSYLLHHAIDVSIYDAFVEGSDFSGDAFTQKHYYKRARSRRSYVAQSLDHDESGSVNVQSPERPQWDVVHFGASWTEIEEAIHRTDPHLIGITNIFRENTTETLRLAQLAKSVKPSVTIALGGPNANAQPEHLLGECQAVDLIGFGDGERTMLALAEYVAGLRPLDTVHNIMYRDRDGSLRRTDQSPGPMNLDEYGPLDYSLLRLERYFAYERGGIMARNKFLYRGSERAISMVTSRGCPYKCSFCSIHIHAGRKFRRHSTDYIITQLKDLAVNYGVQHVHFEDDNIGLDRPRLVDLLNKILENHLAITWDTPNGIYAENLTEDVLRLMKRAGCTYAIIGVESGNQEVLDDVIQKQPLKLTTVTSVFRAAQRVRLDLHAFYIIGFPRESLSQIDDTLRFAHLALTQYDVIPHLSLARADPGTSLYQEAVATGTLVPDLAIANAAGVKADMFVRNLISTNEFSPRDLELRNEKFHRRCIAYVLADRSRVLIRHPWLLARTSAWLLRDITIGRMYPKEALIKLFWCKLLYKNSMLHFRPVLRVAKEKQAESRA